MESLPSGTKPLALSVASAAGRSVLRQRQAHLLGDDLLPHPGRRDALRQVDGFLGLRSRRLQVAIHLVQPREDQRIGDLGIAVAAQGADLDGALEVAMHLFELEPLVVDVSEGAIGRGADRRQHTGALQPFDRLRGQLEGKMQLAVKDGRLEQRRYAEQLRDPVPAGSPVLDEHLERLFGLRIVVQRLVSAGLRHVDQAAHVAVLFGHQPQGVLRQLQALSRAALNIDQQRLERQPFALQRCVRRDGRLARAGITAGKDGLQPLDVRRRLGEIAPHQVHPGESQICPRAPVSPFRRDGRLPAGDRLGVSLDQHLDGPAFEQAHHQGIIPGSQRMPQRGVGEGEALCSRTGLRIPVAGAQVKTGGFVLMLPVLQIAQQVGKQVVVAIPAPFVVQRDEEQVRVVQAFQQLPAIRAPGDRIAQVAAQLVQQGGLEQETARTRQAGG